MKVFLSGFMAAGKSAVGRELAPLLEARFVDLDLEVESMAGTTIRAIFAEQGEPAFRSLESEALRTSIVTDPLVMALGGGTVLDEDNRRLIRNSGLLVWLDTRRSTILDRLEQEGGRPLFEGREQAMSLLEARSEAYRDCDLQLRPLPDENAAETAARIATRL